MSGIIPLSDFATSAWHRCAICQSMAASSLEGAPRACKAKSFARSAATSFDGQMVLPAVSRFDHVRLGGGETIAMHIM